MTHSTHTAVLIPDEAVQAMPERIYASAPSTNGCVVSFDIPSLAYDTEYIRADVASAHLSAPCAVEVTKLEWHNVDAYCAWCYADTEFGQYRVTWSFNETGQKLHFPDGTTKQFNEKGYGDRDAAKAAAQDDFERRILSCVVTKPFDVASALLDTQITENVISFLVSHDMIDESDEYSLQDIMAALYDNYTPNKPVDVAAVRDPILTEAIVRQAMHEAWNDICYDTGCHPTDIEQLGRRRLQFHPHHWASSTYDRIRAISHAEPVDQSRVAQLEAALTSILFEDSDKSEQQRMIDRVKARAVLEQAEPVEQWQDIATAPKDGTWIIAIRPECSFGQWDRVVIVCWSDDYKKWIWPDDVFDVYKDDINENDDEGLCKHDPYQSLDFTHWMPLPAAPNMEEKK